MRGPRACHHTRCTDKECADVRIYEYGGIRKDVGNKESYLLVSLKKLSVDEG
jgi:hypothetical protein